MSLIFLCGFSFSPVRLGLEQLSHKIRCENNPSTSPTRRDEHVISHPQSTASRRITLLVAKAPLIHPINWYGDDLSAVPGIFLPPPLMWFASLKVTPPAWPLTRRFCGPSCVLWRALLWSVFQAKSWVRLPRWTLTLPGSRLAWRPFARSPAPTTEVNTDDTVQWRHGDLA